MHQAFFHHQSNLIIVSVSILPTQRKRNGKFLCNVDSWQVHIYSLKSYLLYMFGSNHLETILQKFTCLVQLDFRPWFEATRYFEEWNFSSHLELVISELVICYDKKQKNLLSSEITSSWWQEENNRLLFSITRSGPNIMRADDLTHLITCNLFVSHEFSLFAAWCLAAISIKIPFVQGHPLCDCNWYTASLSSLIPTYFAVRFFIALYDLFCLLYSSS